jgi:hypothetical protein
MAVRGAVGVRGRLRRQARCPGRSAIVCLGPGLCDASLGNLPIDFLGMDPFAFSSLSNFRDLLPQASRAMWRLWDRLHAVRRFVRRADIKPM